MKKIILIALVCFFVLSIINAQEINEDDCRSYLNDIDTFLSFDPNEMIYYKLHIEMVVSENGLRYDKQGIEYICHNDSEIDVILCKDHVYYRISIKKENEYNEHSHRNPIYFGSSAGRPTAVYTETFTMLQRLKIQFTIRELCRSLLINRYY